jgi:Ca2+-transporting ATPase
VAKDSADIILSDDKFGTIISAVEYGRAIFDNIKNAIAFLLSGNIAELFIVGFAFLVDLPIPLLTIQILWINMITDSLPAIALAFEKPSLTVLQEKPRSSHKDSMKRPIIYALFLSLVVFVLGIILYLWGLSRSVETARTIIFTYAVLAELVYVFSIRSPERIWQNIRGFFVNKFLIVTIMMSLGLQALIFAKPLRKVFSIVPLGLTEIVVLSVCVAATFFLAEITRHYFDKKA